MSVTASEVAITAGTGTPMCTVDITNAGTGNTDKREVGCIGGPNTGDLTVIANVAPASTGAALTDPGLVVGLSPNSATTTISSTALEASHVLKASAGVLHCFWGINNRTSQQYIQVFNSTTVPSDTTVPILVMLVPPGSNFFFDTVKFGLNFTTGISISNSSTLATKTIGSADCFFNAQVS